MLTGAQYSKAEYIRISLRTFKFLFHLLVIKFTKKLDPFLRKLAAAISDLETMWFQQCTLAMKEPFFP